MGVGVGGGNRVKKKKKAQQILKQKTLNQEIYSLDFKEFELLST